MIIIFCCITFSLNLWIIPQGKLHTAKLTMIVIP
jgi:lipopolysaccharide export LptBFGC system permease protein LptF